MYVGFCQYIDEIFLAYERGDFKLSVNLVEVYFELWKRNNSCWGGALFTFWTLEEIQCYYSLHAIMKHGSKVKQEMKWEFIIIILFASFIPVTGILSTSASSKLFIVSYSSCLKTLNHRLNKLKRILLTTQFCKTFLLSLLW